MGRWTQLLLIAAVGSHLVTRAVLFQQQRFFASEDDPYRLYLAYLYAQDPSNLVGRFWLPGHSLLIAPMLEAGLSPPMAGIAVSGIALVLLVAGLATWTALSCSRAHLESALVAAALVLVSPLVLILSHSALTELPNLALVVAGGTALMVWTQSERWLHLFVGALAMLAATLLRYESWVLAASMILWVTYFSLRRNQPWKRLIRDTLTASLCLVGPAVWMLALWRTYGEPLVFLEEIEDIVSATGGSANPVRMLQARIWALLEWNAPIVIAASSALLWRQSVPRPMFLFLVWLASPSVIEVALGQQHPVFPERLSLTLVIGLVPLASWALVRLIERSRSAGQKVMIAAGLTAVVAFSFVASLRPSSLQDRSSVALGLALRRGDLDQVLEGRPLLIERPVRRPPFGWASVATLWGQWDRMVFATPGPEGWELVEPVDSRNRRYRLTDEELGSFLRHRNIAALWIIDPESRDRLQGIWERSTSIEVGEGSLLLRSGDTLKFEDLPVVH